MYDDSLTEHITKQYKNARQGGVGLSDNEYELLDKSMHYANTIKQNPIKQFDIVPYCAYHDTCVISDNSIHVTCCCTIM